MSFDSRIANLGKLIELLDSETNYAPNETELTVASLTTLATTLKAANTEASTAYTQLTSARANRNTILYDNEKGLVQVATDVKAYVKSLFGTKSDKYKQISGLKFTKIRI